MQTTEALLRKIAPRLSSKHKRKDQQTWILLNLAEHFDTLCEQFEVNTVRRKTYFLAQTCHEAAGFTTTQEFASGRAYEGRTDLGNVNPGDGVKFKGHGIMQITGRFNHAQFTIWAKQKFADAPDFEENPELLMEFPWALIAAFWYWQSRDLNKWADAGDFRKVTKLINGGYNGLEDRRKYLARAEAAYEVADGKPPLLRLGSEGEDVRELQSRLKSLGYRVGAVDGDFGGLTESGVRDFQAAMTLTIDGKVRVGGETWKTLEVAIEEGLTRPVGEGRATASGKDLDDSRIVSSSNEGTGATIVGGGLTGVLVYWEQAQEFIGQWITSDNLIIAGSVALNLYLVTRLLKARNARIEDHRKGKTI